MGSRHGDDIFVGENNWIPFADLEGTQSSATNIDFALASTSSFWKALETQCVSDCCGFDAFDFSREGIAAASHGWDSSALIAELEAIRSVVAAVSSRAVVSSMLNNYCEKNTFLKLIDHVVACVRRGA